MEEEQGKRGVWGIASIILDFTFSRKILFVYFHGGVGLWLKVEGKKKSLKVEVDSWIVLKDMTRMKAGVFNSSLHDSILSIPVPLHCGLEGK